MEILNQRQDLKLKVEAWWQENMWGHPPLPAAENMAILARCIATARYEDLAYASLAKKAGL